MSSLKVVSKDKCFICNLVPGHPTSTQLALLPKEERDWLCQMHWNIGQLANPFLALVESKETWKGPKK